MAALWPRILSPLARRNTGGVVTSEDPLPQKKAASPLEKGDKRSAGSRICLGCLFLRSLAVPACLDLGWYHT